MIKIAETDAEVESCFAVMGELRPHLVAGEFLERVKRQSDRHGFQIAFLTDGEVKAVAGIRIAEWLAGGKYLEIEDLVTKNGTARPATAATCSTGWSISLNARNVPN